MNKGKEYAAKQIFNKKQKDVGHKVSNLAIIYSDVSVISNHYTIRTFLFIVKLI